MPLYPCSRQVFERLTDIQKGAVLADCLYPPKFMSRKMVADHYGIDTLELAGLHVGWLHSNPNHGRKPDLSFLNHISPTHGTRRKMRVKPHLVVYDTKILVVMPYHKLAKDELKHRVPYDQWLWDAQKKCWVLTKNPENFKTARSVLSNHFPDHKVFNKSGDRQIGLIAKLDETNHYSMLGVESDATQKEIKRAYRKLIRDVHPDTGTVDDVELFHKVQKAYATLKDPKKRKRYDVGLKIADGGIDTRNAKFKTPPKQHDGVTDARPDPMDPSFWRSASTTSYTHHQHFGSPTTPVGSSPLDVLINTLAYNTINKAFYRIANNDQFNQQMSALRIWPKRGAGKSLSINHKDLIMESRNAGHILTPGVPVMFMVLDHGVKKVFIKDITDIKRTSLGYPAIQTFGNAHVPYSNIVHEGRTVSLLIKGHVRPLEGTVTKLDQANHQVTLEPSLGVAFAIRIDKIDEIRKIQ